MGKNPSFCPADNGPSGWLLLTVICRKLATLCGRLISKNGGIVISNYILFCKKSFQQKLQTIGEDFCGLDVNTPLGGGESVMERPVCTMNNVLLTAVAATSTGDFTVVFLGTSKGHLKKVKIPIDSNVRVCGNVASFLLSFHMCP